VISLVLADVPNESGITARAMQHIVGATQHVVDFGKSSRSLIRDNSPPMSAISAVAILTNLAQHTGIFVPSAAVATRAFNAKTRSARQYRCEAPQAERPTVPSIARNERELERLG
jgi:hypothetical protein